MSRLLRAAALVSLGALALPIVSGGPTGQVRAQPSRSHGLVGPLGGASAASPPLTPVLSLDGQRLAERVRISRSYERPQSPPVGQSRVSERRDDGAAQPRLPGRRANSSPAAETRADRTQQRERPTALGRGAPGGLNWAALRECESSGNYHAVNPSGRYRGAYQFDLQTWASVGGVGDPAEASPAEQDKRAWMLYQQRGRSPWPQCGRLL